MMNDAIAAPLDDDPEPADFDPDRCGCAGPRSAHPVGEPRWCVAFETESDRI